MESSAAFQPNATMADASENTAHSITCFYPKTSFPVLQYPLIVFASTHSNEDHLYHTVTSFVSTSVLTQHSKSYCKQPSRVIGFTQAGEEDFDFNELQAKYKVTFKYKFTIDANGIVTGQVLAPERGDSCPRSMNLIIYDSTAMKYFYLRQKFTPSQANNFLFPQFIGESLFCPHARYLLPAPYVDLRSLRSTERTSEKCDAKSPLGKALDHSATLTHLTKRFKQVKSLFYNSTRPVTVQVGDQISSIVLDIVLGAILTCLLLSQFDVVYYIDMASYLADNFINELEKLINHLMNMPVGLKLNGPLNAALGHFFLYHIYLLRTYLHIMRPLYTTVIQLLKYIGLLGITFILTVSCDIFSLATIHAWCFYGYAVHIYSFNVKSLICLWRLFRGKKWNQLKSRVDSYAYQTDQLLIGCLSFTILLFLLPTVLIYYCVFLMLRLVVISVPLTLKLLVYVLSMFPLYSVVLKLVNSKKISSSITVERRNGQFYIATHPCSLFSLVHGAYSSDSNERPSVWSNLLKNIFQGNVITYN